MAEEMDLQLQHLTWHLTKVFEKEREEFCIMLDRHRKSLERGSKENKREKYREKEKEKKREKEK